MKRFKNILCVVEPEKDCKPILERAVTLAENNQANLTVVNVIQKNSTDIPLPEEGIPSIDLQSEMMNSYGRELEDLIDPYSKRVDIQTKVLTGIPFLETIREVLRNEHDLVVKTPHTPGWLDQLFGSDDMHLLRKCPCPIWLIKSGSQKSFKRILATVDVDYAYPTAELKSRRALNQQTLELAYSLAISDFSELHIMHAWKPIGESVLHGHILQTPQEKITAYGRNVVKHREGCLTKLIDEVTDHLGQDVSDHLKPKVHLVMGEAQKEIPALARQIEANLVVMGTVARTGISGFTMGNTAETILNQINCSVLAIKPTGFITPVTLEN